MPLSRGRRSANLHDPFTIRSERDRRAIRRELGRSLRELARLAEEPGVTVLEVQLVGQVCGPRSYPAWKREQERTWHRQGGRWTTRNWPAELGPEDRAAVLLPLPAGRVGLAAGKRPKLLATPMFSHGPAPSGGTEEDLVLGLISRWVGHPPEDTSARLAPPVLELIQDGRVSERRLVDFDQSWPLPAPDGLP